MDKLKRIYINYLIKKYEEGLEDFREATGEDAGKVIDRLNRISFLLTCMRVRRFRRLGDGSILIINT